MTSTANVFDLLKIYKEYFGKNPYHVNDQGTVAPLSEILYSGIPRNPNPKGTIHKSFKSGQPFNKIGSYGQDIWFPIKLVSTEIIQGKHEQISLEIDICTISVNLSTTIVSTPIEGRKGMVNEIVNQPDNKFTIRGMLVGKNRKVPEDEILKLKYFKEPITVEATKDGSPGLIKKFPVQLHGGYVELFLFKSCQIVVESLEFPEVQGQNHWIRPFTMVCQSDDIEDLAFL